MDLKYECQRKRPDDVFQTKQSSLHEKPGKLYMLSERVLAVFFGGTLAAAAMCMLLPKHYLFNGNKATCLDFN